MKPLSTTDDKYLAPSDGAPEIDDVLSRFRSGKATPLCNLTKIQRQAFVTAAAKLIIESPSTSAFTAACIAAKPLGLVIHTADQTSIRKAIVRRYNVLKNLDTAPPAHDNEESRAPDRRRGLNRGNCGRKPGQGVFLQADKHLQPYRGAVSQAAYITSVQSAAMAAATEVLQNCISWRAATKLMMTALAEEGITLKKTACMNYIKQAVEAGGGKPPTPQKPGGVYVPFKYEQRLAEVVKVLRDKKFPVFPDLVCHWCTQMVAGTEYASYFPEGKATIGWYRGWLRRTPCLTGHQRPLEMTRHQWLTEGNLEQYFEICANVLVKAGVAERNPAFDPNKPEDEMIFITHPERIASADETKCELDCTNPGRGSADKIVRANCNDDGEVIVTKSNSAATIMCGRTGDGKPLPPYTVFASGESFHWSWAKRYESEHFVDKEGNPLMWRYASNLKGSLKEELYVDYLQTIVHPALGYPPTRDVSPGQQGVLVVDGVGTHVGFFALESAISLGLEIVLRVPNLSYILQGEDTVNFRTFKVNWKRAVSKAMIA